MQLSLENSVETPLSTKNVFIRTSKFPLERKQTCSILVLVLRCISALNHDPNTVDWTRWRHKITAQRGPVPSSCIEPRIQVLHWALHLLEPALLCAYSKDETPKSCCKLSRHRSNGLCFHDFVIIPTCTYLKYGKSGKYLQGKIFRVICWKTQR